MQIDIGLDDILLISPILTLFVFSLIPITFKLFNKNEEPNPFFSKAISIVGIVVTVILISALQVGEPRTSFSGALIFDGLSYWVGLLTVITSGFCLFLLFENAATKGRQLSEQIFLLINSAVGMLILLWANDLIVTFIGLEIMSLALYLLIALSKEERLSKEAAFKYFILGSFASAILLYGIAFIYGIAGTTHLDEITQVASRLISINSLFLIGFFLVVLGFCFKVSIFPFHMWTPDVYQGSPTPVTIFMATAVKMVSFTAFLRILATKGLLGTDAIVNVLQWLAVLTMIAGNLTAILQNNFKRMLAYSSIAHSGYALVGLIAAGISGNGVEGASGLMFYLFSYIIMTLGAFALVSLFERNENSLVNISDFKGLANSSPTLSIIMAVLLFSLAGLPPTLGFFGKFYLFSAAIDQGLIWLSIWAMISSVIGAYYYLRPMVYIFMSEGNVKNPMTNLPFTHFLVIASAISIFVIGIFSRPFYQSIKASVISLF